MIGDLGPATSIRRPCDVRDAVRLVGQGCTPLGGGAALYSRAFPRVTAPGPLVDLSHLGLDRLEPPFVGAGVSLERIACAPTLVAGWPVVASAAQVTATPGVRTIATLGGTVAARLTASDLAAALDVHAARVVVLEAPGNRCRHVDVGDYWAGALHQPHVVVGVILGDAAPGCYRRWAVRRGPTPAVASVAGVRRPDGAIHLRAGAVADRPLPVDPVTGSVPPGSTLRVDDRAGADQRARLVASLARDVVAALR